jgi:3-(3-hydroxy-phenyl)propionate hydroxylase
MQGKDTVLICGGGPVGLFCALLLGRRGLKVRLFDNNTELQDDPRAATTHPATLEVLDEAGLVEDMAREGLVAPIFQFWDRQAMTKVAEFDLAVLSGQTRFPYVIQCEQFKTSGLILKRLEELPNVEVFFDSTVTDISQDNASATVTVLSNGIESRHSGAYLIGADGGRSTVRKQAKIDFPGFTWEERFLVLTTPFDFEAAQGVCYRSYFADPDEWCNCFKVSANGPPGLWRTVFPVDPSLSEQQIMNDDAVQARLHRLFRQSRPYDIVHRNLYSTHQRMASTFRRGRVLLVGDAAHINNPIGGLGLNGGLQDAANLNDKLGRVMLNGEPDSLLDLYSLQRHTAIGEFVQAQSIANKKRLEARAPEIRAKNFQELTETAATPELARNFLMRSSMITLQQRAASITLADARVPADS